MESRKFQNIVLLGILILLAAIFFKSSFGDMNGILSTSMAKAEPQQTRTGMTIPKSWGNVVGYDGSVAAIVLQASDGTIRIVGVNRGAVEVFSRN